MKHGLSMLTVCAAICFTGTGNAQAAEFAPAIRVDAQTLFLLRADPKTNTLADETGKFIPAVKGGTVVDDKTWGKVIRLGDGEGNAIVVKDEGKMDFTGGFTLEVWICLEEPVSQKEATLALKMGSFNLSITNENKFNCSWLTFPTEEIFTTTPKQYNYFPVGGDMFNGFATIPLKKWVCLALSYDQERSSVRTWVNGMPDRSRYRTEDHQLLKCDPTKPLSLMSGFKNCLVGPVRLSRGPREISETPAMEMYVNQLPYQDKVMLTFDHIDPKISLPIDVTIVWEMPNGPAKTVKELSLASAGKTDVILDSAGWKNCLHMITVRACSQGKMIFSKTVQVANTKPEGTVKINPDNSLSVDGKKIFPLVVYHALPEDFSLLSCLGFNILTNGFNLRQLRDRVNDPDMLKLYTENLKAAKESNLLMFITANTPMNNLKHILPLRNDPALGGWYGFDEPWGNLDKVLESYNVVKLLAPDKPIVIIQNNYVRLQETAQGADIIGCDPYPIPNVSLRAVADATEITVRSVSGKKPVWTVIPQYESKIPTVEELRCMAYLAITAGANGIGLYAWDDRFKGKGWYTKDHPEQVETLRKVFLELKGIENILVIPNSEKKLSFTPENRALHAAIKEDGGKKYLLVANDSRRPEEGVLSIEGVADAKGKCTQDGGTNAGIDIRAGKVSIKIPALGAAVYELSP